MLDDERGFFRSLLPRRPKDAVCLGLAIAASGFIAVNALYLQKGPHPAPFFTDATPRQAAAPGAEAVPLPPARRQATAHLPAAPLPAAPATPVKATGTLPPPAPVKTTAAIPVPPAPVPAKPAPARSGPDPIAELLEPTSRTVAVQRVLAEYGYGQIKPTGLVGPETKAAIEKFERERKLPVTGQVSDRLVRELSAMTGKPL